MYGPRMMLGPEAKSATCGVLYVHSAPSALCPHIEWAVGGVLGAVAAALGGLGRPGHVHGNAEHAADGPLDVRAQRGRR